uniref:Tc1-like transposase DDE domain-containing protein n=1 Tax=Glossina morsitans morsitans TaxID=37546 RepID=A0A1B0G909_GLOMM
MAPELWEHHDLKHTALNVKLWLLCNTKHQLNSPLQLAYLNPIEHLWDLVGNKIRQHAITSKEMLKNVIMEEWANISEEETTNLVKSMPSRLAELLKCKRYPTSY